MLFGFLFFSFMSCLDYFSNNDETFSSLRSQIPVLRVFPDIKTANKVEESAEILGETFFLAAFLTAFSRLSQVIAPRAEDDSQNKT